MFLDKEWGLLIILDVCRYDLFAEFTPKHSIYKLFDLVERIYSIASQIPDWLERTFERAKEHQLSETLYISDFSNTNITNTDNLYKVECVKMDTENSEGGFCDQKVLRMRRLAFSTNLRQKIISSIIYNPTPFCSSCW